MAARRRHDVSRSTEFSTATASPDHERDGCATRGQRTRDRGAIPRRNSGSDSGRSAGGESRIVVPRPAGGVGQIAGWWGWWVAQRPPAPVERGDGGAGGVGGTEAVPGRTRCRCRHDVDLGSFGSFCCADGDRSGGLHGLFGSSSCWRLARSGSDGAANRAKRTVRGVGAGGPAEGHWVIRRARRSDAGCGRGASPPFAAMKAWADRTHSSRGVRAGLLQGFPQNGHGHASQQFSAECARDRHPPTAGWFRKERLDTAWRRLMRKSLTADVPSCERGSSRSARWRGR